MARSLKEVRLVLDRQELAKSIAKRRRLEREFRFAGREWDCSRARDIPLEAKRERVVRPLVTQR